MGSYGSPIFNVLRNLHNCLPKVTAPIYIPTSSNMRVSFSPHPHQHVFLVFLMIAIITVWSNISLWCWFAFSWWWWTQSLFACPFGHLHVFFGKIFIQIFYFLKNQIVWGFIELYELFIYGFWFTNIFFCSVGFLLILLMVSFAMQKLFSLM